MLLLALIPFSALALLLLGLRGKSINDHPTCSACRFDLIGLTAPAACPECGSRLDSPRAIRHGARRKRRGLIITGSTILLLCVLAAGAVFNADKLIKHEPSWLLLLEAERSTSRRTPDLLSELIARSDSASLSQSNRARLAHRAAAVQADAAQQWGPQWASILVDPKFTSTLLPQECQATSLAGVEAEIPFRHRIRQGQKLPMAIKLPVGPRFLAVGRRATVQSVHITLRDNAGTIIAQVDEPAKLALTTYPNGWGEFGVEPSLPVPPGDYQLEATCPMTFPCADGNGAATMTIRSTGPLTVVPPDQSTVELIHDPEGQKVLTSSLVASGTIRSDRRGGSFVGVAIEVSGTAGLDTSPLMKWATKNTPLALVSQAFLTPVDAPSPEIPARAPTTIRYTSVWSLGGPVFTVDPGFKPGRYRLRLTPSVEGAERTRDIHRILGDDIVLDVDISLDTRAGGPHPSRGPRTEVASKNDNARLFRVGRVRGLLRVIKKTVGCRLGDYH